MIEMILVTMNDIDLLMIIVYGNDDNGYDDDVDDDEY
jgi:hypothetical protein